MFKLEKMDAFFEARLDGYEEHMLSAIEGASEFYPFTAKQLPVSENAHILDLGCGTGLELNFYFQNNPYAQVTGIDLSKGMLDALKRKFPSKNLTLCSGSYFDFPFGENLYDAAVSVESLHHFTQEEKIPLYKKLSAAVKPGGYFILTDYFAASEQDEQTFRKELLRLKSEQGLTDGDFYHYDTPLTLPHELEALTMGGFFSVEILGRWGATVCIKANRI